MAAETAAVAMAAEPCRRHSVRSARTLRRKREDLLYQAGGAAQSPMQRSTTSLRGYCTIDQMGKMFAIIGSLPSDPSTAF